MKSSATETPGEIDVVLIRPPQNHHSRERLTPARWRCFLQACQAALFCLLLFCPSFSPAAEETPARALAGKVAAAHRTGGPVAALDLLNREYADFRKTGNDFAQLYPVLWNEAQLRGGRDDPHWGAALFDWIQKKALAEGADHLAVQVAHNTYSGFANLGRYGAARQALQPFIANMQRNKMEMDPANFRDRGPAFTFLPEVRKRDFMRSGSTPSDFAALMMDLAEEDFCDGRWKTALERMAWVDAYIEHMKPLMNDPEERWLQSRQGTAFIFYRLGLLEAADTQYAAVLANEASHQSYYGRSRLVAHMGRLKIRLLTGDTNPEILRELDEILKQGRENRLLYISFEFDVQRARALYFKTAGRWDDALAVLDGVIGKGEGHALLGTRIERVRLLLEAGRTAGLEGEIKRILTDCRRSGRKLGEGSLYSMYAEFLEKEGRLQEALAMRMEAVRLTRTFNLFVDLPVELAKLSALLLRCGSNERAATVAAEATRLASDSLRIPARIAAKVASILKEAAAAAKKENIANQAYLQPIRALVMPLAGMPMRGMATLTNPSTEEISGTLSVSGTPASLTWDPASQAGSILIGKGQQANQIEHVKIAPGTYAGISLLSEAGAAINGELKISWTATGKQEQSSVWTLEPGEEEVSAAVIEAGLYQSNPFYSIPVYHHYQEVTKSNGRAAIRVSSTPPARVEIHDAMDRPVAVDATGNGSLGDAGDGIFQDEDFDGVADLQLNAGEAGLRLQVFPVDPLPEGGLEVVIEVLNNGAWHAAASSRIMP